MSRHRRITAPIAFMMFALVACSGGGDVQACEGYYDLILTSSFINASDSDKAAAIRTFVDEAESDRLSTAFEEEADLWQENDLFVDSDVPGVCRDLGVTG